MPYRNVVLIFLLAILVYWVMSALFHESVIPMLVTGGVAAAGYALTRSKQPHKTASARVYIKPPPAASVEEAGKHFETLTNKECKPQLGALNFMVTESPRTLDHYFPIVKILSDTEIDSFYQLVDSIANHPNFDIHLIGDNKADITDQLPVAAVYLIAGHIAEVFFFRQKILERFLNTPRIFKLYATAKAFEQDGGVKGGDFSPKLGGIQLVLSRLFEGFNGETPGACPFLHEFGHMLDHFDAASGSMGNAKGLYPGLSPTDGDIFNSKARDLFIKGKRLELDRYRARETGDSSQPMPIGGWYVFQNNGEFAAGYFEAFFRNPNYIAAQNPDLFNAYVELFGYDPRKAWKEDYPNYINKNRQYYSTTKQPPKAGITIPEV